LRALDIAIVSIAETEICKYIAPFCKVALQGLIGKDFLHYFNTLKIN